MDSLTMGVVLSSISSEKSSKHFIREERCRRTKLQVEHSGLSHSTQSSVVILYHILLNHSWKLYVARTRGFLSNNNFVGDFLESRCVGIGRTPQTRSICFPKVFRVIPRQDKLGCARIRVNATNKKDPYRMSTLQYILLMISHSSTTKLNRISSFGHTFFSTA